jgi:rfaE bifunctional protein kinase chain/domain
MSATRAREQRLRDWVSLFAGQPVAVLGDLVADEFVFGDINCVSREAPVLILDESRRVLAPGGAANSVANLRALGACPIPVGVVGQDEAGRGVLTCLREQGVRTARLVRDKAYATPTKSRILAGGIHTRRQQVVRIDRGRRRGPLDPSLRRRILANLRLALDGSRGLLIADYGYGAAAPSSRLQAILRKLATAGTPVTIDSRTRVTEFRGMTVCSPNQEELESALGGALVTDRGLPAAGKKLLRRTGNRAVLVTRGAKGMTLFEQRMKPHSIPAYGSEEVADVTGAGDTVIATLTLALIAGAGLVDAAMLANYAAGIVVQKMGTATVSPGELLAAIKKDHTR